MSQWLWQWLRLPGWPVLPHRLWLTLGGLVFCLGNLLGKKELWPHTSMSEPCFLTGAWLAFVCALPQLGVGKLVLALGLARASAAAVAGYSGVFGWNRRSCGAVASAGNHGLV